MDESVVVQLLDVGGTYAFAAVVYFELTRFRTALDRVHAQILSLLERAMSD